MQWSRSNRHARATYALPASPSSPVQCRWCPQCRVVADHDAPRKHKPPTPTKLNTHARIVTIHIGTYMPTSHARWSHTTLVTHFCHTSLDPRDQPQNNKPPIMHAPSILQTTHNHMPPQTHGSIAYALVAVQQACARHLRPARKPIVTRPVSLVSSVPCRRRS